MMGCINLSFKRFEESVLIPLSCEPGDFTVRAAPDDFTEFNKEFQFYLLELFGFPVNAKWRLDPWSLKPSFSILIQLQGNLGSKFNRLLRLPPWWRDWDQAQFCEWLVAKLYEDKATLLSDDGKENAK